MPLVTGQRVVALLTIDAVDLNEVLVYDLVGFWPRPLKGYVVGFYACQRDGGRLRNLNPKDGN